MAARHVAMYRARLRAAGIQRVELRFHQTILDRARKHAATAGRSRDAILVALVEYALDRLEAEQAELTLSA